MPQLVGGDMPADFFQHRLGRRLAQCAVVRACAHFDDAARHHLPGARAAARAVAVEIDLEPLLESGEGSVEIEFGIGQRRPACQRAAVLDLLFAPAQCDRLEFGIVGEDPAEVVRVSAAIMLDEARRLDDADELRIEFVALEAVP